MARHDWTKAPIHRESGGDKYYLREWLIPNEGGWTRELLGQAMESSLSAGKTVWLIDGGGSLIGLAKPNRAYLAEGGQIVSATRIGDHGGRVPYPWSDCHEKAYKSAADLLADRDGLRIT